MLKSGRIVLGTVATTVVVALGITSASAQAPEQGVKAPAAAAAPDKGTDKGTGGGEPKATGPRKSKLSLRLKGLSGGKLKAGKRVTAAGTLRPFAKGERVTLYLRRGEKTIARKTTLAKRKKGSNLGQFSIGKQLIRPGRYTVQAVHGESARLGGSKDRTRAFKIRYPDLNPGNHSTTVRIFNRLLAKLGYVNDEGKSYDSATGRAVLAFRKVNKMSRVTDASASIFKKLADGRGGYKLRYPNSGKHVEADISRQVMVLAKGRRVDEIYHVSSGASATPTPPGSWRFYRKEPGYNNKEMYYSVYWNRGYATHGYKSVPTSPASHGCLRNPPADAVHIYNWIDLGDLIHIYP